MFLSTLDTGIVSIAIPYLSKIFSVNDNQTILTVSSYTAMLCGSILIWGYVASKKGKILIFNIGIILFLIFSLLCAFSNSINFLITTRALQGVSAGMIQATALSLVSQYLSKDSLNKGISIIITVGAIGPLVGPIAGGIIIKYLDWEYLFILNIPFCIVCIVISNKIKNIVISEKTMLSKYNLILYSIFIISLISSINFYNFKYSYILFAFLIITFILIIISELKQKHTVFKNIDILNRSYYKAISSSFVLGFSTAIVFIIPPIILIGSQTIGIVSAISFITPASMVVLARLSPKFITKYGVNITLQIGLFLMALGLVILPFYNGNLAIIILGLSIFGFGCGLLQPSATIILFKSTNISYHSIGNSFSRALVNMGIAIGSTFVALFINKEDLFFSTNIIITIAFVTVLFFILYTFREQKR